MAFMTKSSIKLDKICLYPPKTSHASEVTDCFEWVLPLASDQMWQDIRLKPASKQKSEVNVTDYTVVMYCQRLQKMVI